MKSKVCVVLLLVTVLLTTGSCQNRHHHQDVDENWPIFISKIELLWKSTTIPTATVGNGNSQNTAQFTTELVMQNGTFVEDAKDTFRASLALLIGAPIFGILLLCCCCYCCCKCCSICCEDEEKGNVIVMQQNNAPAPAPQPPTHIIVQQPMYQQPPYAMQPPPQWSPHAPQFPSASAAYDNPNYGAPSAPLQYAPKY